MFIHFAFGSLGKQGKSNEQTEQVIERILKHKRLKVSKCTEFIPKFPEPGTKRIPMDKMKFESDGSSARLVYELDPKKINELPDDESIYYHQRDVSMVCFIKIAFNQLRTSNHWREYGKFGIVLTDRFIRSVGARRVQYYTEESIWSDPLIRKWNYGLKGLSSKEKGNLEKEILAYRKPATYFSAFKKSVMARITADPSGGTVQFIKYDRYEEGYDFTKENEHRIVFGEDVDYLYFNESDLYMIITPDSRSKNQIETYLNHAWNQKPQVKVFPS